MTNRHSGITGQYVKRVLWMTVAFVWVKVLELLEAAAYQHAIPGTMVALPERLEMVVVTEVLQMVIVLEMLEVVVIAMYRQVAVVAMMF